MYRHVLVFAALIAAGAIAAEPSAVTAAPPAASSAAPSPSGVVAYRQIVMAAVGKHMKALSMITKGEVDRPGDVLAHAEALHAGSKGLAALFPAGTGPEAGKTSARPEVWTKHADFEAAAKAFEAESARLVELARAGDKAGFGVQLGKVGDTCGGCHEPFKTRQ